MPHSRVTTIHICLFSCLVFLIYVSLSINRYFVPLQHITLCLHITTVIYVPSQYITYGLHITTLFTQHLSNWHTSLHSYSASTQNEHDITMTPDTKPTNLLHRGVQIPPLWDSLVRTNTWVGLRPLLPQFQFIHM